MKAKTYIVVVQCHIVKQRCSGYLCEYAFNERDGRFFEYPKDHNFRFLTMTCGGCCGRAVQRKLRHLVKRIKKTEDVEKDQLIVHLSSCIAFDNSHGPPCPHKEYLRTMICDKLGLDMVEGTRMNEQAVEELKKRMSEGG